MLSPYEFMQEPRYVNPGASDYVKDAQVLVESLRRWIKKFYWLSKKWVGEKNDLRCVFKSLINICRILKMLLLILGGKVIYYEYQAIIQMRPLLLKLKNELPHIVQVLYTQLYDHVSLLSKMITSE